jgi:predicted CoA-binding protein
VEFHDDAVLRFVGGAHAHIPIDPALGAPQLRTVAHTNPPDTVLRELLISARRIAIVGLSSNPARPSYGVARKLQSSGYTIVPVNPNEREVLGEKAYPSLDAIPDKVDIVDVFRRSEYTPAIAADAVKIGARALWLQVGVASEEAARIAARLVVVMDDCIAVAHSLLRIPPKG